MCAYVKDGSQLYSSLFLSHQRSQQLQDLGFHQEVLLGKNRKIYGSACLCFDIFFAIIKTELVTNHFITQQLPQFVLHLLVQLLVLPFGATVGEH